MLSARPSGSESYSQFMSRLNDLLTLYLQCKDIVSFDCLRDDILLDLFVNTLSNDVKSFVLQREPKNATEATVWQICRIPLAHRLARPHVFVNKPNRNHKVGNKQSNEVANSTDHSLPVAVEGLAQKSNQNFERNGLQNGVKPKRRC